MSNVNDGESEGGLTDRGKMEKDRVSKTIYNKKRAELESFFHGYRAFVKMENADSTKLSVSFDARQELFYILIHELERTLTTSQRDYLVQKWKPVISPIILIGSTDQLKDIRSYINSRDMSRVNFDKEKKIIDLRLTGEYSDNGAFATPCLFKDTAASHDIYSESLTNVCEDLFYPDFMEILDGDTVALHLIDNLYMKLSLVIERKEDVLPNLMDIKANLDMETFCGVINFTGAGDQEPVLFQLVLDVVRYEMALDLLRESLVMNLSQRNIRNLSIFSFLLFHGLEKLHQFLTYTKSRNMVSEVRDVCTKDQFFKKELSKMKGDGRCNLQLLRSVEKFCFF